MRSLIKVGALTLTTLVVGAAFIGCSSGSKKNDNGTGPVGSTDKDQGPVGGIGLSLQPVPGITVNTVRYSVSGGTGLGGPIPTITNDLPTPGTASNFSFGVPLPVGTGYQLSLTAESAETGDNITCTGGFGPFNITPNQVTNISLTLTCVDNTNGSVVGKVNVVTEACPTLDVNYAVATPHTANVGSPIGVFSLATDTNPALPISYQWSVASPIGNFAVPTDKDTTFNCTAGGQDVLITVTASNGVCDTALSTVISCANVTCGDNVFNPAVEACDNSGPPATDNPLCLPNCTLAVCGNGGPPQTPVEQCEPPNTATCTGTCQTRPALCNDGFLTSPEPCDPSVPGSTPAGATCNNNNGTCELVQPAVCGNQQVQGAEICDEPGGPQNNYAVVNCGGHWNTATTPPGGAADACLGIESASCQSCVAAAPACATLFCESPDIAGNAAAGPASGQPKAQICRRLLDCMYDTNCAASGLVSDCYCGSSPDCASAPTGACRALVEAAAESTSFIDIGGRFGDESFALGKAAGRVDCANAFSCGTTCGIQ